MIGFIIFAALLSIPTIIDVHHAGIAGVALFQLPEFIIKLVAAITGKKKLYQQLYGSLSIDISKARSLLGWIPPVTADEALKQTGADFLKNKKRKYCCD